VVDPIGVTIGDRLTFANAVAIPSVSNLRASWEISRIGLMSCDVMMKDLPAQLTPPQVMLRKWISCTTPAGPWGGVITSITTNNGLVTLDCESWATMLRGALTRNVTQTATLYAGLKDAIDKTKAQTGIGWGALSLPNPSEPWDYYPGIADVTSPVGMFLDGQDIFDALIPAVMDKLYDEGGWKASLRSLAWNIDPVSRLFYLDYTYGIDRTGNTPGVPLVAIQDRVHCVDSSWTDDIGDLVNQIFFFGTYSYTQMEFDHWDGGEWHNGYWEDAGYYAGHGKKKHWVPNWIWHPGYYGPYTAVNANHTHTTQGLVIVDDATSQAAYGVKALVVNRTDKSFDSLDLMTTYARGLAADLARNQQIVSAEINNVDGVQAKFAEGDILRVEFGNSDYVGHAVVRARAYDSTRGTVVWSGEANRLA
jgi:hypothetical protein